MFTQSVIQECLTGLIGFYQPDDPSYPNIDEALTRSDSGLMLQNIHSLCSLENIYNAAPEFASFDYPAWSAVPAYAKGARVTVATETYQADAAVAAATAVSPSATGSSWTKIDALSEWLKRVYGQAVSNLMNTVAREKKLQTAARALLDSQQLYQGYGMLTDKIIKHGRFVGFEISLKNAEGLVMRFDQIGLQSDTAQDFDLYLYNSSQADPIKTFHFVTTKVNTFSWQKLVDAAIGYMANDVDTGSRWFLGYYEDDIAGQVISKQMNISAAPCLSCDSYNIMAYNNWSKHAGISSIEVPFSALDGGRLLFDTDKVIRTNTSNWGLNLSVSVICDLSAIACTNKYLLADALGQQLALELLQHIAFNTRIGAIADKTKQLAMAELDDKESSGSFKAQYLKAVRALQLDLSGMNDICLPCSTKGTIRKRAI